MPLALKLPPRGRVIVNGCVMRNADRVQTFYIENKADVILEKNLVRREDTRGMVAGGLYEMLQTALLAPEMRPALLPEIQDTLARLIGILRNDLQKNLMDAATHVSVGDFYSAMRCVRPVWDYEAALREQFDTAPVAESPASAVWH